MKRFIVPSSWSRKAIGSILVAAIACMVACGDDSSSSGPNGELVSVESSSSSKKLNSSSSVIASNDPESSSSSEPIKQSSSSLNCSVWSLTKDAYLNPNINYGTMTDERDGYVYRTVKIGDQTWMAENLNFDPGQGGSGDAKYDWSWCYNNEPKNCDVAGRLYTWAAAIDSVMTGCGNGSECRQYLIDERVFQGICPMGWHLPSRWEWKILLTAVGGQSTAGKVLKSQMHWNDNGNGTDAFGFSALPTGAGFDGEFGQDCNTSVFWSATDFYEDLGYGMLLWNSSNESFLGDFGIAKSDALSVRCVKN